MCNKLDVYLITHNDINNRLMGYIKHSLADGTTDQTIQYSKYAAGHTAGHAAITGHHMKDTAPIGSPPSIRTE